MVHNSPILNLSQELLDVIVDTVAFNNPFALHRDLRSCSSISSTFCSRSQLHLFTRTCFGSICRDTRIEQISRLLDVLVVNPQLAAYVKEICLYVPQWDPPWIGEDAKFLRIVNIICAKSSVSTLTINGASDAYEHSEDFMRYISNFFTMINHSLKYLSRRILRVPTAHNSAL